MAASLVMGVGLLLGVQAQGQNDTVRLSCQDFLIRYGIDTAEVADTVAFRLKLESLSEPYAQSIETCNRYSATLSRARVELANSGTERDGVLWIDERSCYEDYGRFASCLQTCHELARTMLARYTTLEEERLAEERRQAEERARQEAQRRQDELDARWQALLSQVESQHEQILSLCDGNGISDKARLKELSDLGFDYRNCHGRFNLSATQGNERTIERTQQLCQLQRTLIDSVLGPNSYTARIDAFPASLKTRAGKEHHEVYKSYGRVFKNVRIPTHFGQYEEFDAFVARLRDIVAVQQGYVTAIEMREEIANNATALRNLCGKKHKALFDSYARMEEGFNKVPAFATLGEMEMFLATLTEFMLVQNSYQESVHRINAIQQRGDSIVALCVKPYADAAISYRELVAANSFVPSFSTMQGAGFFHRSLDDFEELQADYIQAIGLRQEIALQDASVQKCKKAPKILLSYYKDMKERTPLTASFNNHEKALQYLDMLWFYSETQRNIMESEQLNLELSSNTQTIKAMAKNYPNIWKAYNLLYQSAEWPKAIRVDNDLARYVDAQHEAIAIQQQVMHVLASDDAADKNNRLKALLKDKNKANIRIILEINGK